MGRTCKGICLRYKAEPAPNKIRYEIGQKHCTFCGLFLKVDETRCICCKAVLRTKSRGRKIKRIHDLSALIISIYLLQ